MRWLALLLTLSFATHARAQDGDELARLRAERPSRTGPFALMFGGSAMLAYGGVLALDSHLYGGHAPGTIAAPVVIGTLALAAGAAWHVLNEDKRDLYDQRIAELQFGAPGDSSRKIDAIRRPRLAPPIATTAVGLVAIAAGTLAVVAGARPERFRHLDDPEMAIAGGVVALTLGGVAVGIGAMMWRRTRVKSRGLLAFSW